MKIILLGNAGSGKSTMARRLIDEKEIARLSLDEIAWDHGAVRRAHEDSVADLNFFLRENENWIIEGCYSDLVEVALPHCTELRFLNPGVSVCMEHCSQRPWEPEKFATPNEQQALLDTLLEWVQEYETRDDEYGMKRHRQIFDSFAGPKREYREVAEYNDG